ncbi:hypothetical protein DICVIV_10591 [Dictyocaulus viviparus]|uniref:TRAF3-interacting protein 1 N-terminal domain-containing protein n=1 Tax=Dictyocaulus viviparus TaxID=29172 RepID=A0A0D8XFG6_DICVI|nr:hypothetical protein DICVIV_10591 [Dictyocaulus viviparus]
MVNAEDTRKAFSALIDKPPLTDKLLARPPFKFILDIVQSIILKTGYLKEQFSSDDLNPSKFIDKTTKIAFLDSLVKILNDGTLDNVKSSKIVAGKEPELTNLLLIKLAEKARAHLQNKKTSKHLRTSHHRENVDAPSKSEHRSKSKESKGEHSKTEGSSKENGEGKKKLKNKSSSKDRGNAEEKSSRKNSNERNKKEKSKTIEKRKKDDEDNRDINSNVIKVQSNRENEEPNVSQISSPKNYDEQPISNTENNEVNETPTYPHMAPQNRLPTAVARPQTSLGRPGTATARPPPPKLKRKQIATSEDINATPAQQKVDLICETAPESSSNETFLIEDDEDIEAITQERFPQASDAAYEQGGLVRKIVDTTVEFEINTTHDSFDMDREEFTKEKIKSEALLNDLQEVTRTAHPLSRVFDFVQVL